MFDLLREYYVLHGDLNVPSNYVTPEGEKIGAWIKRQRRICGGVFLLRLDKLTNPAAVFRSGMVYTESFRRSPCICGVFRVKWRR